MKRILQIVPSLNINAGMMSVVMNYYRHIDRNKVQFDFLYFFEMDQTYRDEIISLGGRIYYIGKPSFKHSFQAKYNQFLKQHKGEFAAIHCHPIFAPEIFSHAAKKNGIKHVIAHSHSTKYSDNKISAIRNYFINLFVGICATEYMACSPEAAKLYGKRDVKILRNSIEGEKYRFSLEGRKNIREELGIDDSKVVVGHVGRFVAQKNHKMVIDIYASYHNNNENSVMLLAGDGPLKKEMEEYAVSKVKDGSIIFLGRRSDISQLLSAFDVFILPSLFEGAPVSAIEAQFAGLPCLLSDTITKSINATDCEYLPINASPDLWARKIKIDEGFEVRLTRYQKTIDFGFDIQSTAKELEDYYLSL